MRKDIIFLAALFLSFSSLSGCAMDPKNKTLIVLQNPETKDVKQCTADAWTTWNVYAQVEACAKAYEKAGYKRMGDY